MKATEQYFLVVQFIMLYKVVLAFESVDEILKCDIQMKPAKQYCLLWCIMQFCDHSKAFLLFSIAKLDSYLMR